MITKHSGLKAVKLAYAYDQNPLFSGVEIDLIPGQTLQVLGENGKGKTTLLRILAGLLEPSEGKVYWKGHPIRQSAEVYYTDLVYLGHLFGLKPYLTAYENLELSVRLKGYASEEAHLRGILSQVGLQNEAQRYAYQLSAGQRQRLALARLIAFPNRLWILDEPFSVLCQSGQHLIGGMIERHASLGGMIIFTSHHRVNLEVKSLGMLTL